MPNTIRTIFTARIRFALLALGAISLSSLTLPAMAGDDAPDAGAKNPSTCRDVVNHKCLTKPRDDQSGQNQDTRNQDKAAQARAQAAAQKAVTADIAKQQANYQANRYKYGRDDGVFGPGPGWSVDSRGNYHPYNPFPNKGGVKTTSGSGGNGGAAGHKGSRMAPAPTRTSASAAAAPPKAATPKSTTTDKATNTTTRDYRTGATAAPGGPPPAAAIGSSTKPTAEQLAAQSGGTRDHRRK
jgi:hypothetical protein